MQGKPKLIIILGPTASGKSELAVFLAREIKKQKLGGFTGAEIISADSRQVYKYLDVGTNKVPGRWKHINHSSRQDKLHLSAIAKRCSLNAITFIYKNIPHHCIDFVHPKRIYTVAEFKQCAEKAIAEIQKRGNIPMLVGGTGLYIRAVADGMVLPEVPSNKKLRTELKKKSTIELFNILQKLDPERAINIDAKNPRRLIRAIEICKATGKQVPALCSQPDFETLFIGIKKSDLELKRALQKRSKKQIPGLLKEIRLLLKMKVSKKRIRELGFEYKLALETKNSGSLASGIRIKQLAEELMKENWHYAKRQMTWFKPDTHIKWISNKIKALIYIKKFLNQ